MTCKNKSCSTSTKFKTLASSEKKSHFDSIPQLKTLAPVKASGANVMKRKPAGARNPPAWSEQVDRYNATRGNFAGFDIEEIKKRSEVF